jgi:hypothetical protein
VTNLRGRSEAFAAQAASDLDTYEALAASTLPACHRLHYLQMWLEKLCKAYLWLPAASADEFRTQHNVIARVLPRIIAEHWRRISFSQRPNLTDIRDLCREIDLLHPQIDDGGRRPDNSEYPWTGRGGDTLVPSQWTFPIARRLHSHTGRLLMKAAKALTRNPAIFIE